MPDERKPASDAPEVSAAEIARREPGDEHLRAAAGLPQPSHDRSVLLGRKPHKKEPKGRRMKAVLKDAPGDAQLDMSLRDLLSSGFFSNWRDILSFWKWVKGARRPKVRRQIVLDNQVLLDQGNTGHCVGFAWSGWHNTDPLPGTYTNADGHAVYYECKAIDGEPQAENGSYTSSGVQAMTTRKLVGEVVWAKAVTEIVTWLLTKKSSVIAGTVWDGSMFTPDAHGYIRPNGQEEGGHEWEICGYDDGAAGSSDPEPFFWMQNSWGAWGLNGRAKITVKDMAQLLGRDGDACAALEVA